MEELAALEAGVNASTDGAGVRAMVSTATAQSEQRIAAACERLQRSREEIFALAQRLVGDYAGARPRDRSHFRAAA